MHITKQIIKHNRLGLVARVTFIMILILQIFSIPAPVKAANATIYHEFVPAGAEFGGDTCPNDIPQTDTQCEVFYVLYWLGGLQRSDVHWGLFVDNWAIIIHPDGTITDLWDNQGFLENPQGSFDMNKYTYAQVEGSVPMSDGSIINVDLIWDMALAELHHGGNDSIYNQTNDITRHYASPCLTLNQIDHQQWRAGYPGKITGSIGGIDIQSFTYIWPDHPFIEGRDHWTTINVSHGGCIVQ